MLRVKVAGKSSMRAAEVVSLAWAHGAKTMREETTGGCQAAHRWREAHDVGGQEEVGDADEKPRLVQLERADRLVGQTGG